MNLQLKKIVAEPFIQFFILGGLLFLLVTYFKHTKDNASREISVDGDRVFLMMANYKTQTGNLPTKQQLDAMIDNYIKEEISYREAKKMGLDKDDEIIRRRLSQKFDFMQTDLAETSPPTEEQLKIFYDNNASMFQKESTVSFSHIYFSTDNSNESIAKQRSLVVLQQISQTNLKRAPEKGDRFALQYDYTDQAIFDVQQNFGNSQLDNELFKGPINKWVGPVKSGYGWHLIFISKRDIAAVIPYNSIKEDVATKYMESLKTAQNKKVFDELSDKYVINRAYLQSK